MPSPTSRFVNALGHQLHYLEWNGLKTPSEGAAASSPSRTVVMIHGLTRTAHDFVPLANYLSSEEGGSFHCISFDVIGRGLSTWAAAGDQTAVDTQYAVPFYIQLFVAAFTAMGTVRDATIIGTSMGGIIGFVGMGSGALCPFFSRLVMNDIGPYVPMSALRAIGRYTDTMPTYATAEEVLVDLKKRMATFGEFTEDQFLSFAVPYIRRLPVAAGGGFTFHYDERILEGIRKLLAATSSSSSPSSSSAAAEGTEALVGVSASVATNASDPSSNDDEETRMRAAAEPLWSLYGSIKVPILLIRGEQSELLLQQDAERMVAMKRTAATDNSAEVNGATLHLVPNCGHAPMLTRAEDMVTIRNFLQGAQ